MSLKKELIAVSKQFPNKFKEWRDGSLIMSFVIAERKTLFSKKKLIYKCKVRINDEKKEIAFFEILSESNSGLPFIPGYELNNEIYGAKFRGLAGGIEESSNFFVKKYKYSFDYKKVREAIQKEVEKTGYSLSIKLLGKFV